jgi:hypothetical protein
MAVQVTLSRNRRFRGNPSQGPSPDFTQNPFQPDVNSFGGVGCKINGQVIGGKKNFIELTEILDIPIYWEYNIVNDLVVDGVINVDGEINILQFTYIPPINATIVTTSPYTILTSDVIIVFDSESPVIANLPNATSMTGKKLVLKNINSGNVTVNGDGSQTIDNQLSQNLGTFDSFTVQSIGTSWIII